MFVTEIHTSSDTTTMEPFLQGTIFRVQQSVKHSQRMPVNNFSFFSQVKEEEKTGDPEKEKKTVITSELLDRLSPKTYVSPPPLCDTLSECI